MATLELPVRGDVPAFDFKQDLDGTSYTLTFRWNSRMNLWIFSLATEEGVSLLEGLPVQTDVDIKGRFKGEDLPTGLFLAFDETGKQRNADRETFGKEVKFLYQEANG